ncbi:MAG: flagellar M-ring protein FliF C-terminal domain-containing protein, partial [Candidatus Brocadiia bacterium]
RVVVSERIESSESSGAGTRVGGAVGRAGNVPGEQQAAGTEPTTPSTTQTEKIDTEYVVSESVQEEVTRGASIQRLTVAAFVDMSGDRPAEEETAEGEEAGAGATAAAASGPKLEDVSRIIKEAIGFNESRGDTLKIVEARFHPLTAELEDIGGGVPSWVMQVGQYGAIVVLGVVLLVIGRRVLNGIASAAPRRVVVPEIVEGEGAAGPPAALNEDEIIRREIARFVAENPEMAGRMIEGWVEGEE